jgi:hypothetical protein
MNKFLKFLLIGLFLSACNADEIKIATANYASTIKDFFSNITQFPYKDTFKYVQNTISSKSNNLYKNNYSIKVLTQPEDTAITADKIASFCETSYECNLKSKQISTPSKGIDTKAFIIITINNEESPAFLAKIKNIENTKSSTSLKQKDVFSLINYYTAKQDVLVDMYNKLVLMSFSNITPDQQTKTAKTLEKTIENLAKNQEILSNLYQAEQKSLIKIEIKRNYYSNLSYFKNLFYTFVRTFYVFGFIPVALIGVFLPWFLLLYTIKLLIILLRKKEE